MNPIHPADLTPLALAATLCGMLLAGACSRISPDPATPPEPKIAQPVDTLHRTGETRALPLLPSTVPEQDRHWREA